MVVFSMGILLMVSLIVMLHYSRKTIKEEALQKATQTLEGLVQRIDNILLSVEQTTGNIYFNLLPHLDQPDMMFTYCRKLVEANPYVVGCAIAFKPYYYENREYFMAYVHRTANDSLAFTDSPIIQADTFGDRPYTQQVWFTDPMASGIPLWLNPLVGMDIDIDPIITFCLPIPGSDGQPVGIVGVDVSIDYLSEIILKAKPSENSYCTLLMSDVSFLVHPDSSKLFHQTVFTQSEQGADPSVRAAAEAMVSGETGYKRFLEDNTDYYVFYKPFKRTHVAGRSMEELGWSAGIIYPEDDIFGDYNSLLHYIMVIAIVGILLLFVLSRTIIHQQLKPLLLLTRSAHRIAKGNYNEPIPDSHQQDEIGRLQDNFKQMQQSLATHVSQLEQLKENLQKRGEGLRAAYNRAQMADRLKTAFLHNMTNQMIGPANAIDKDVETLCDPHHNVGKQETVRLANDILQNGDTITELLNNLINMSIEDMGKEGRHD